MHTRIRFQFAGNFKECFGVDCFHNYFTDKPAALITASSSGKIAHESLLLVMKTLGIKTTEETCLLIQGIKSKMDQDGQIHHPETLYKLNLLLQQFAALMES